MTLKMVDWVTLGAQEINGTLCIGKSFGQRKGEYFEETTVLWLITFEFPVIDDEEVESWRDIMSLSSRDFFDITETPNE